MKREVNRTGQEEHNIFTLDVFTSDLFIHLFSEIEFLFGLRRLATCR